MTESTFTVPAVDISPFVAPGSPDDSAEHLAEQLAEARAGVAAELDTACRTVGFVQILGHGVAAATIAGLAAAMDGFFGQELEAKKAYRTAPEINRGYAPPKSESLSLSLGLESATRMNDFFEAFNVGVEASAFPGLALPDLHYAQNTWPGPATGFDAEAFRAGVSDYFAEAGRVARTLTRIFADSLGVDPAVFASVTDHSLDVLRMNNYALPEGTVDFDGDLVGMGEHTDYGIVTVLWADQVAGLQVLGIDGLWHDVSPADDALLVNLGDLTARWTNEQWMSTLHRVKPPIVDGSIRRRRSAAYFHDGNVDAVIRTIPQCVGDEGELYPPITVGDHIEGKLAGSRAGRRNETAAREAARVLASQTP